MTTLPEFLLARLAELEEWALAEQARLDALPPIPVGVSVALGLADFLNPARVLADVEAKRRIVALYADALHLVMVARENDMDELSEYLDRRDAIEPAIRALAAVYADHEDYDEGWKP